MGWYMTSLRFLHVLFSIVVIGSVAYNVLFLGPALSRLGTSGLAKLFDTDWGRAVTGGFLLSAVMSSIGVNFVIRNIFRMRTMALAGTPPVRSRPSACRSKYGTVAWWPSPSASSPSSPW